MLRSVKVLLAVGSQATVIIEPRLAKGSAWHAIDGVVRRHEYLLPHPIHRWQSVIELCKARAR